MYSEVATVRLEAGDPNPHDVPDSVIEQKILAADTIIRNSTQHDWQPSDASFFLAQLISELLASSFIMDKFDDPKDEAEKNWEKGMMLLQLLVTEDEGSADVVVTSPAYQTWPLNPNAKVGRSRLSTYKIGEVTVDPDEIYEQEF